MKKIPFLPFLLLGGLVLTAEKCKEEQIYSPTYMKVVEAVYASGKVIPSDEVKIFSTGEGVIVAKNIIEGDEVAGGAVLFKVAENELETVIRQTKIKNAEEMYQITRNNYSDNSAAFAEIEAGISAARIKIANDSLNYIRFKTLYDKEAATKAELEKAETAYKLSRSELDAQYKKSERLKNQLYTDMKNAEGQVRTSKVDNRNFEIKSPSSGKVFSLYKEQGEAVKKNEVVAVIGKANQWILQLLIDEQDLHKIKTGQDVVVNLELMKDKVFHARIVKIYPSLNTEQQSVRVDAQFTDSPLPDLVANASVEANIILNEKDHALVIPKILLVGEDSVNIRDGEKNKRIKITKGIENLDYIEVLSGVTEKTILLPAQ
ncbi:MAG: efflux RND transporter periplasmic adaptor subunit [Bacteroidia bacterium]|nr:efflux RND transporter periplasmic adaptor subunit [Bacteroidia bacterium]